MSSSIRASSPAPVAANPEAPAAKPRAARASHNPFRRSVAFAKPADGRGRPHSFLDYLGSFGAGPGPQARQAGASAPLPPSPRGRATSIGSRSDATSLIDGPAQSVAPSIRLDPYATGEFKDTEQKRFLGVGPKIYTRAEKQLKDKLRTQANFNFDEVFRLREAVADLKLQLHEVREDRDVIRDTCTELEQTLAGHKATIKSFEAIFLTSVNEVSDLKDKLRAKEQQLEQIASIVAPTITLSPALPTSTTRPKAATQRSFGRQTFGAFDDAHEAGPSHSAALRHA